MSQKEYYFAKLPQKECADALFIAARQLGMEPAIVEKNLGLVDAGHLFEESRWRDSFAFKGV